MSSPTTPSPPVLRPTALATHPDLTYVWPSSASAILCPPTERQQPHGDDKGVMQVPAGNRIDEARVRRDPPRITFLTAADPFGSTGPLTEPAQASENWVATRRLHDSRLRIHWRQKMLSQRLRRPPKIGSRPNFLRTTGFLTRRSGAFETTV